MVVTTKDGADLWAAYPSSDAQTSRLIREHHDERRPASTSTSSRTSPTKPIVVQFLLPILLLVCLFVLFTRIGQDGGAGAFAGFSKFTGKGRKRGADAPDRTTFDDVAGAGEAVAELREIRDYLADPRKYEAVGARAPKGVLLVGPAGNRQDAAGQGDRGRGRRRRSSRSPDRTSSSRWSGVGAARVRDLFAKARKMAPALIFIDELDAAGRKRGAGVGQGNDEREQTLNALLVEMDGFGGDAGHRGARRHQPARRPRPGAAAPGRFDRQVTSTCPTSTAASTSCTCTSAARPLERRRRRSRRSRS